MLRTYLKFLSRHKVYSFVSVAGFAVSLTFVIVLSVYSARQVSMDSFHENKERIYVMLRDSDTRHCNPLGDYVMDICSDVETYTRVATQQERIGASRTDWHEGRVMFADRDFFKIFSFPLISGEEEYVLEGGNSAVLSLKAARKLFGNEDPVGKTIWVAGGQQATVTGVMKDFPYNTHFEAPEIIVSYPMFSIYWEEDFDQWANCGFMFYFLETRGSDLPSRKNFLRGKFMYDYWPFTYGLNSEVNFIRLDEIYYSGISTVPAESKSGSFAATRIYMVIAFLVLLIALLNYINMTVAQAGFRGKEAAVRKLMGSSRTLIVCQHLIESVLMTAIAMILAVGFAVLTEPWSNRILDTDLGVRDFFSGFGFLTIPAAILAIALLSGILPALTLASFKPVEVVKGTVGRKIKTSYSKLLIIFQFAVCTVLLTATFFMRDQAAYMLDKDVGFNRENIIIMSNVLDDDRSVYGLRDRLMLLPGVKSVGFAYGHPFDGGYNWSEMIDGQLVSLQVIAGDTAMASMLGLNIKPQHEYESGDTRYRMYLSEMAYNALGPDPSTGQIGDWGNFLYAGSLNSIHVRSLHSPMGPVAFRFMSGEERPYTFLVEIASDDLYRDATAVRRAYADYNGGKSFDWYFAEDKIIGWYANERRMSAVMAAFTLLSIVIMVMGVFAMSIYMIRQKEKEIGMRKVSGATVGQILVMLGRDSLSRVVIAVAVAFPVAYIAVSRWLEGFPYRINIGPGPFIASAVIVVVLCLASVSWLAWRAARANPMESLKDE